WGVALGCYPGSITPAAAKVSFNRDGSVDASVSGHEMGQGLRTAIALVVGERLGVAPESVQITVGDTKAPPQQVTAGSWGTASRCRLIPRRFRYACRVPSALSTAARSSVYEPRAVRFLAPWSGVSALVCARPAKSIHGSADSSTRTSPSTMCP